MPGLEPELAIDSVKYEQAFEANPELSEKYNNSWDQFRIAVLNKLSEGVEKPNRQDFKLMEDWMMLINKGPVEAMLTDLED